MDIICALLVTMRVTAFLELTISLAKICGEWARGGHCV